MDHIEECPSYYVDCWGTVCYCDYSHICICRELRACEERMLDNAISAVREAIGKEWHDEFVPKDEYDCCGCSSYDSIVNDATVAIDALRKENDD